MIVLVIVIVLLLVVALYPVVRDVLRRRRALAPAYVEGLQLLVECRRDEAIAKLTEAVQTDTGNIDAYVHLGNALIAAGQLERGVRVHEGLALRRNLTPAEEQKVFKALARDYLKTDRKAKAVPMLEELARLDRRDTRSHEELFRLYLETGSWEKCQDLLRELGRNPADRAWVALLHAEFGRAYADVDSKSALDYFRKALELDSKSLAARLYLGDLQMAQGEIDSALETWNEIIAIAPAKNHLVRQRLETAYYELGRYDDTVELYDNLLRKVPDDAGLVVALAQIYLKKETPDAAAQLLERFVATHQDPLPKLALAAVYAAQGSGSRAGRLLADLVERFQSEALRCPHCGSTGRNPAFSCSHCRTLLIGASRSGSLDP